MSRLLIALVVSTLCLMPFWALAADNEVTRIAPHMESGQLLLDADVDFSLTSEQHEAAERGVPLYFTADLELTRPRWWWFDKNVISTTRTWRIQFNALTRQWRIRTGALSLPTASLEEALNIVRRIRNWPVGDQDQLKPDVDYEGSLRLRLDTSRLSRPFQVDAINSSSWSLTTPWKHFAFSISADAAPR